MGLISGFFSDSDSRKSLQPFIFFRGAFSV